MQCFSADRIERSIAAGTTAVIEALVEVGELTGSGPITDSDVRTIVFVSVATAELLDLLLDRRLDVPASLPVSLGVSDGRA